MAPDTNGELMRPGLIFISLFAVLIVMYVRLTDALGTVGTVLLQAALILVILIGALWFWYTKRRSGWIFFGDEEGRDPGAHPDSKDDDESADEFRQAS
jgi:hypothetical protein